MIAAELKKLATVLDELQTAAKFPPESLIVIGCSSSEVLGKKIGTDTSLEVAMDILPPITAWADQYQLYAAVQCCEHINRCLVVEEPCVQKYGLEAVNVIPYIRAGGALASAAMERYKKPVVVESLLHKAHGGMDIGNTFIGMHLRHVAVCVRTSITHIGSAAVNCVRTRPLLVGGSRAKHNS